MNNTVKHNMEFFKDFTGSLAEFRTLLHLLQTGSANQAKYGSPEKQMELYNSVEHGFTAIHPNQTRHSTDDADLGQWLYINSRYYKTAHGSEAADMMWDEWETA